MNQKIAQIDTDWQDGVQEPLDGDEEEAARNFINKKLQEWGIAYDDDNLNDYIARAWDEWVATDEAIEFCYNSDLTQVTQEDIMGKS